jgi:hypothetical protein
MYTYYDQYVKSTGDADAQDRWARQLIWEVARHAIGEELVIYPLMERHLGAQGQRLADEDRADHQVRHPLSLGSPRANLFHACRKSRNCCTTSSPTSLVPNSTWPFSSPLWSTYNHTTTARSKKICPFLQRLLEKRHLPRRPRVSRGQKSLPRLGSSFRVYMHTLFTRLKSG